MSNIYIVKIIHLNVKSQPKYLELVERVVQNCGLNVWSWSKRKGRVFGVGLTISILIAIWS
jgi:hypothetical protein